MAKNDKTNVMRLLDSKKVDYTPHFYSADMTEGRLIAKALGEPPERVFKTLVAESASGAHYVFVIPVEQSLDLKKAARAVGEKSVSMLKQKNLLPLTGYIHGGCSPLGMKKPFKTVIHSSAAEMEMFFVSAGRVGAQVEVSPADIARLSGAIFENIICALFNSNDR